MSTIVVSSSPERLNNSDLGPSIIITAGIMLGSTVMALTMRLHQRWPCSRLLRLEDNLLVFAVVIAFPRVDVLFKTHPADTQTRYSKLPILPQ